MNAKPYPKYKASGVEWLGEVPEHWEASPLKRKVQIINGGTPSSSDSESWDGEIEWFTPQDMGQNVGKVIDSSRRKITEDGFANCGVTIAPAGSILISTRAPIGHVAITGVDSCCNQGCRLIVPRSPELFRSYGYYVILASKGVLQTAGKGTTFLELSGGALGMHAIPMPPILEQQAIADFLDDHTTKLDALVEKKRALIGKLKEKRSALISRTVTKGLPPEAAAKAGLNPKPKLKSSGIPWLGDIPEHWELSQFRRKISELDQGWSPNANNYPADANELGVLKLGAARQGRFQPEENKALDEIPDGVKVITPRTGDILLSRSNTPELVGDVGLVTANFSNLIIPDLIYRLRLNFGMSSSFVCWFLLSRSCRAQIEGDARGSSSSMVKLGQGHVRAWTIPLPSLFEQETISTFLDQATSKIDRMIQKVETAIEKLTEYRTALITAAVTGKIDVRKPR